MLLFCAAVFLFSKCVNNASASNDPRGIMYAGAQTCRQCHQAVYDSFVSTAHFNSTATVNDKNIHGSFLAGHNTFNYNNGTQIRMEKRDSGYFQAVYKDGKQIETHRIDVLFGGKNAQTYIFWKGDQTFELPISHYSFVNAWGTSPGGGFTSESPYFKRAVVAGCFECHSSAIKINAIMDQNGISEKFIRGSEVYGIDCERCHGPAANHVNYHLAYPDEKVAKYMVKNASLTRQQKSDACAVCHGGNDKKFIDSRFAFVMGDTLAKFFMPYSNNGKTDGFDVHGNQSRLLEQSQCYRKSAVLNCNTCHSPHTDASRSVAVYSQKCMSCHNEANHNFCPKAAAMGESIKSNCIDCHMPKQSSQAIVFQLSDSLEKSAYILRTHRIAVYKDSVIRH